MNERLVPFSILPNLSADPLLAIKRTETEFWEEQFSPLLSIVSESRCLGNLEGFKAAQEREKSNEVKRTFIKIITLIIIIIIIIIVSITKFSIVIGSPRAHLSCNQRAMTWVSSYRYPTCTLCNWTPTLFVGQLRAL